nr:FtsK/SpoIIIE domain-containing protein [Mycobacterium lepraemurium]
MTAADALTCARRLAGQRVTAGDGDGGWPGLVGLADVSGFDSATLWGRQTGRDRLPAPLGVAADGTPVELDIKEPAEHGMGPHGLCVGATGSGKSELLRTIALGAMARNSPEVLNLLLVDFKGGATFLDYANASHVAAVITNLADDAPLVAWMGAALAGEMNCRQEVLRTAGCDSVAAYQHARRTAAALTGAAHPVRDRRRVLRIAQPATGFRRHLRGDRPARPVAGHPPAAGQPTPGRGSAARTGRPPVLPALPENPVRGRIPRRAGQSRRLPPARRSRRRLPAGRRRRTDSLPGRCARTPPRVRRQRCGCSAPG